MRPLGLTCLKKPIQLCIGTLHHRSQYPLPATHSTLPKPTKPFISGYSVIAIVLHFSAWQSLFSCLLNSIISLTKARGKGIDGGMAKEYNRIRSHSAPSCRSLAPEVISNTDNSNPVVGIIIWGRSIFTSIYRSETREKAHARDNTQ